MGDSKYGRIFTTSDVAEIIYTVIGERLDVNDVVDAMDRNDVRFKFPADEPLFVLRAQDRRALGSVRYYEDNQSSQATSDHMDAIRTAVNNFEAFRVANPHLLKEPD